MKNKLKVKFRNSLASRLIFWFLALSLVPLSISVYNSYSTTTQALMDGAKLEIEESSKISRQFINNWFHYRELDIKYWSSIKMNEKFLEYIIKDFKNSSLPLAQYVQSSSYLTVLSSMDYHLIELLQYYDYIYDILLLDKDGNILYTVEKESDLGTNLLNGKYKNTKLASSYKKTIKDSKIHFSDLELYEPSMNTVAGFLTAPLLDDNADLIGAFIIQIKLDHIFDVLNLNSLNNDSFLHYIVGIDGLLRSKIYNEKEVLNKKIDTKQFQLWYLEHGPKGIGKTLEEETVFGYKSTFDEDVYGVHSDISILGVHWALISERKIASVLNSTKKNTYGIFLFFLITTIIITLIASFITKRITKPIIALSEATTKFSNGSKDIYLNVTSSDEIGQLANSFKKMIDVINKNEDILKKQSNDATEALLELNEQKLALDAHSIVAITNIKGDILFVNDKFVDISGYTRDELIGQNHRLLNSGKQSRDYWFNMYKTVSSGKVWHDEVCNITKNGTYYWVDTTIVPFMDEGGKPKSYIAIRTDITEKKAAQEELLKAKELAEESVKTKSEFLASMSHEIRTPMNGVIGMLGLLMNTKLDDTQKHQATLAQNSAKALLSLINDILDFSKVEAGKMDLEYIDFNLRDELGDFAESIGFRAQDKGVELILDVSEIKHSIVNADSGRIRQILSNIVGNSIKFTKEGYILIKASLKEVDEKSARLIIEMSDTGIGIPEDKIDKLFDSFSQVDASTTRKYGGTGLGLAIVEKLVALMDGTVKVTSVFGQGSKFIVDIAVNIGEKSQIVKPTQSVKDKTLLIVDKCYLNVDVITTQLKSWGMKVFSAVNEEEALSVLENKTFDMLFVDMLLQGIGAENFARELRKDLRHKDMKIFMMTSLGDRGDASTYEDIGFNGFFPKPTTSKDIFYTLGILLNNHVISTQQDNEEEILHFEDANILLVEDNLTNQLVANGLLEEFGLEADVANNGVEALEILNKNEVVYDIILMDCQMPEMDGYETTEAIRDEKAGTYYKSIPVVAMTANAMAGDREKCVLAGMDDYISKPINPDKLKEVLKKYLLS